MNAKLNIRLPLSGMPMNKLLFLTVAIAITFDIHAQDRHFSQFFNSPIQLNPALAGVIDGTYRVNLNYRDQWNKLTNGNYLPLTNKQITFWCNTGEWDGNDLIIDSSYKADSVVVKATVKDQPQLSKTVTIYLKKRLDNPLLKTEAEILNNKKKGGS